MKKLLRDYGLALVLLAGCALLSLILLLEVAHYRSELAALKTPTPSVPIPEPPEETLTEAGDTTLKAPEDYGDLVERPLFQEGRRPVKDDTASSDTALAATPFNFKLMGVIMTPKEKTVLLLDGQNKYKRARMNAVVAGWKIVEISQDRVTLQQGGERRELALLKPKPKTAPPQPGRRAGVHRPETPSNNLEAPPPISEPTDQTGAAEEEIPPDEEIQEE